MTFHRFLLEIFMQVKVHHYVPLPCIYFLQLFIDGETMLFFFELPKLPLSSPTLFSLILHEAA